MRDAEGKEEKGETGRNSIRYPFLRSRNRSHCLVAASSTCGICLPWAVIYCERVEGERPPYVPGNCAHTKYWLLSQLGS